MSDARTSHWDNIYRIKAETDVSWFQQTPEPSLTLLGLAGAKPSSAIIDIGGGASHLVDALLGQGFGDISVLDISQAALDADKERLGAAAQNVHWICSDVTAWRPERRYDVWHDRAAFHFLTDPADQAAYVSALNGALVAGGHAIIGTFAPDGPEKCSGLPIVRHDADSIGKLLGDDFVLLDSRRHEHRTPWGSVQQFQFSTFRKRT
ncbi:SAM-dependent methyltransferase [Aminobacter sp. DSM 101952]|uniref:class I SAM-dependent methyltransferase n=1 Tax=Aminobacter sp. DSM 101952 TaxID=2735891 RepID=UPI0006FDC8A5|nr:class I SAM-dependent methyltransferase [Aminobacter sp. DSM 101952]KQU69747.1 SAM-dependent methyltransferase [Aminobacter sp. DSM 101952]